MRISDEAVESAVEQLAFLNSDAGDQLTDHEWARAILEAAAPLILAPVTELADELVLSALTGTAYQTGRGSGFRIAGTRIRQVLGLTK